MGLILRWDEGLRQKWDVIGHRGVEGGGVGERVSECSGRLIFIFLLKEIGFV